jgi:phospholipid/cholesterol/gamma-HCH transport system substrate-binding protein
MKKANPAAVGAFVLGAVGLVIVGVIALGSGSWLRHTQRFVLYFDGTVNGLTVGSPVKMRGVEVGSVVEVNALADTEDVQILNQVVIDIDPSRFKRIGPEVGSDMVARAEALVQHGMRARLELQSLVTGQLYVGFDFYPDTPIKLTEIRSQYPELPVVPSVSQEVADTLRALVDRLQKLPLDQMVNNISSALAGVDKLVNSPDLQAAFAQLDDTVTEVRSTVRDAKKLVSDVDAELKPILASAADSLDRAQSTLANIDSAVQPGSDVRYELTQALTELSAAGRAVRQLADYVERNPNSLVFGRPSGGDR